MSAYKLNGDGWIDDGLRAVPLPDGLRVRLLQIPSLDEALCAVALPNGLIERLQATPRSLARQGRWSRRSLASRVGWRSRFERTAVAAVLLLAVGGSYAVSLAAFLWASYPAARLSAAVDRKAISRLIVSPSEEMDEFVAEFEFVDDLANSDLPARHTSLAAAAASTGGGAGQFLMVDRGRGARNEGEPPSFSDWPNTLTADGPIWAVGPRHPAAGDEPLLLASADVTSAMEERLEALWRQAPTSDRRQVLLTVASPVGPDRGIGDEFEENLASELDTTELPLRVWPVVRELVELIGRLCEQAAPGTLKNDREEQ